MFRYNYSFHNSHPTSKNRGEKPQNQDYTCRFYFREVNRTDTGNNWRRCVRLITRTPLEAVSPLVERNEEEVPPANLFLECLSTFCKTNYLKIDLAPTIIDYVLQTRMVRLSRGEHVPSEINRNWAELQRKDSLLNVTAQSSVCIFVSTDRYWYKFKIAQAFKKKQSH